MKKELSRQHIKSFHKGIHKTMKQILNSELDRDNKLYFYDLLCKNMNHDYEYMENLILGYNDPCYVKFTREDIK